MDKPTAEELTRLESEHGPCIIIEHHDGSCFVFKRLEKKIFELREMRAARGEAADDMMMNERCVWPSREEWQKYDAAAAFEVFQYTALYKEAHGGKAARKAHDLEANALQLTPGQIAITQDGREFFVFRKPLRAEVKAFTAMTAARARGESVPNPIETVLRACGGEDFGKWLDENLFGVSPYADVFVTAFGMGGGTVTGK